MINTTSNLSKIIDGISTIDTTYTGVAIDSRCVGNGNIFIALHGNRVDGHDYIQNAFQCGASCCIINHVVDACVSKPYILVENTYIALRKMAEYSRTSMKPDSKVIAITGSAGKSTTKNWLSNVLGVNGIVYSTYKNHNTYIGTELTLANMPCEVDYCVLEHGMNHRYEISPISLLSKPNIALITNIKPAHMQYLQTIENIAYEKADIVDGMQNDGLLFINKDETPLELMKDYILSKNKHIHISTYGYNDADSTIESVELQNNKYHICARCFGKNIEYIIPNVGEHFILNTLAIMAIGIYLGINIDLLRDVIKNIELYQGKGKQYVVHNTLGQYIVIDESYNANPYSVIVAINKLGTYKNHRKVVILGDMLELGDYTKTGYDQVLKALIDNNIDIVHTSGVGIRYLYDMLPSAIKGKHSDNLDINLVNDIHDGDVVLIKGSRGQEGHYGRMYKYVEVLINL